MNKAGVYWKQDKSEKMTYSGTITAAIVDGFEVGLDEAIKTVSNNDIVRLRLALYGKYCRLISTGLKSPSS
jgi:hypothetical protein